MDPATAHHHPCDVTDAATSRVDYAASQAIAWTGNDVIAGTTTVRDLERAMRRHLPSAFSGSDDDQRSSAGRRRRSTAAHWTQPYHVTPLYHVMSSCHVTQSCHMTSLYHATPRHATSYHALDVAPRDVVPRDTAVPREWAAVAGVRPAADVARRRRASPSTRRHLQCCSTGRQTLLD